MATSTWGEPGGARVLLVHGVGANGAGWWRVGQGLADRGIEVTAVDLRGHGRSPASISYTLEDHASDLGLIGDGWDVAVGHSLGGPILATSAAGRPGFARRMLLLDPVFELADGVLESVIADLIAEVEPVPDRDRLAAANPRWHPEDARHKADAARATGGYVVERCLRDNAPWHHLPLVTSLVVPTRILGADRRMGAMFLPEHADGAEHVEYLEISGSGHSMHRERPDAVIEHALACLRA